MGIDAVTQARFSLTAGRDRRQSEDGPSRLLRKSPDGSGDALNPLVTAANPLINLIPVLRNSTQVDDALTLQRKLVEEMRLFEQRALAAGVTREEVVGARYCLCTAIDEAAAQTPWGSQGVWGRYSLLVTFHNETWGGEKYYQLLARLAQNPDRHHNLIELLYFCTALGFEGKFRIVDNGHSQLEILRRRIATLLGNTRGEVPQRLSPHWTGVGSAAAPWRLVPTWVVAAVCAFLGCLLFVWFQFALGPRSDAVFAQLAGLQLPSLEAASEPLMPPPRLRRFLEPEIRDRLIEVHDLHDRSVVTLLGDGLFESGRAEIKPHYLPVLVRVARALNEVQGGVLVRGYTDNVPMRSVRFPSNWHLSQARADSVAALLGAHLLGHDRVRAEGRGEADPVATNTTQEGRALNRRVEITLMLSADEIHRQLNPLATSTSLSGVSGPGAKQ